MTSVISSFAGAVCVKVESADSTLSRMPAAEAVRYFSDHFVQPFHAEFFAFQIVRFGNAVRINNQRLRLF